MYCKPKDIARKFRAGTLYSQSLAVTMILKHTVNYISLNHQESKKFRPVGHVNISTGADCNLGPTWEQNSCGQRKKIFCSRVSLICSQVEVFWGQLGMFQGQYTVQVAPQTAPHSLLLQTE